MRASFLESDTSGTDGDEWSCGSLVKAQTSARLDVPTALHFFAVQTKESNTRVVLRERFDLCTTDNRP